MILSPDVRRLAHEMGLAYVPAAIACRSAAAVLASERAPDARATRYLLLADWMEENQQPIETRVAEYVQALSDDRRKRWFLSGLCSFRSRRKRKYFKVLDPAGAAYAFVEIATGHVFKARNWSSADRSYTRGNVHASTHYDCYGLEHSEWMLDTAEEQARAALGSRDLRRAGVR